MRPLLRASLLAVLPTLLLAQAPPAPRPAPLPEGVPGQLMKALAEQGTALADLQELCDTIGPRMTGSDRLRKAQAWAIAKLTALGAVNVHQEPYAFGHAWTRGEERARLLTHNQLPLMIAQQAFTPGFDRPVQGEVLEPADFKLETLQALKGQLKGKILLRATPPRPPAGAPRPERMGRPDPKEQDALTQFLKDEGVLAVLTMSNKAYGLLTTGGGAGREPGRPALPGGILTQEGFRQLQRLLARKEPVRLELMLGGRLSKAPVLDFNVVGEVKGAERPDEVVILGAHLDSWDLGTGATDNGTGSVAALGALRALAALPVKPKRTIRVVLFSGEEQGLLGSKAYAEAHKAELDKVQAVLVDDMGTGRIRGWALQGREDLRAPMAAALAPMNDFGLRELPLTRIGATDHASFLPFGVPAFSAVQDPEDYNSHTHHSHVDTFERVQPEALLQGAQALAVTAWELANGPALPHRAPDAH